MANPLECLKDLDDEQVIFHLEFNEETSSQVFCNLTNIYKVLSNHWIDFKPD